MNKIKTSTRNVKQSYRMFTDSQRKQIIYEIDNRPSNVSITEMFLKFGMTEGGNLYYRWKKKFGMSLNGRRSTQTKITAPTIVKTVPSGKRLHIVTLRVEVGSLMELIGFCTDIVKTPKVKSVLSVE